MSGTIDSKTSTTSNTVGTPVLGGDLGRIHETKGKPTPNGASFGTVLAAARPILKGAESAASVLPGGPLLAAAVKGPTSMPMSGSSGGVSGVPSGATIVPRLGAGPGVGAPAGGGLTSAAPTIGGLGGTSALASGGVPGVGASGAEGSGMESVIADSQAFNLYYLQLQEEISAENRSYSALSNVLKARHDTVKNAIGNIR